MTDSRPHVLCVEDNQANAKLITQIYKKRPHIELLIVGNAEEGLRLLKEQVFGLILMDINLPGINGFEAVKTLRQEGEQTPIIAISANALPADISYALQNGFDAYLTKPVNVLELLAHTDKFLGQQDSVPAEAPIV